MSFLVGLTGGIGSGKSTVAILFKECGAKVVDSDEISHELTLPGGGAIEAIRAGFGDAYIRADGALDRDRMRKLVFANAEDRRRLEAILHPMIRSRMIDRAGQYATGAPYVLMVVPLLFEGGNYRELVQRVLVVDCDEETQVARTMKRSGMGRQEVNAIMAGQLGRGDRLQRADDVIHNDGDMEQLRSQVKKLHRNYLRLSSGSN